MGGGGGKVGGASSYNTLLRAPLAHWAIITARSEKLCVLLLLVIVTFYAFCFFFVFNLNASIVLGSKSSVRSSSFTSSINSHVTRHMSALDQLKHSFTINRSGSFFPWTHAGDREFVQFPEEFANF